MAKSKSIPTNVPARVIRAAFHNGELTVPDAALPSLVNGPQGRGRGRLHKAAVEAYLDLNPGTAYAEKVAEAKTVTLPVVRQSKTGARLNRPVDVPLAEARRLSGTVGQKGRLSKAALLIAAESYVDENPAK